MGGWNVCVDAGVAVCRELTRPPVWDLWGDLTHGDCRIGGDALRTTGVGLPFLLLFLFSFWFLFSFSGCGW